MAEVFVGNGSYRMYLYWIPQLFRESVSLVFNYEHTSCTTSSANKIFFACHVSSIRQPHFSHRIDIMKRRCVFNFQMCRKEGLESISQSNGTCTVKKPTPDHLRATFSIAMTNIARCNNVRTVEYIGYRSIDSQYRIVLLLVL